MLADRQKTTELQSASPRVARRGAKRTRQAQVGCSTPRKVYTIPTDDGRAMSMLMLFVLIATAAQTASAAVTARHAASGEQIVANDYIRADYTLLWLMKEVQRIASCRHLRQHTHRDAAKAGPTRLMNMRTCAARRQTRKPPPS